MSELLQSGQHPDADQLSAFIEHALPAHEQEKTLAHLAICPHCRNIVALSLPPAEELAKAGPAPVRRPWLSGWIMVWPAGAALAALVLAGIYIRNGLIVQSHVPPTQTAQSRPPEQAKPLPPTMTLKLQARGSAVPQAAPVPDSSTQAAVRLMPVPGGGPKLHTNQNSLSALGASKRPVGAAAKQSAAVISGGAADQAIRTESPAVGGILAVDQAQVAPGRHGLPSGLRARSTVANARRVVAIDTDNTLFFSSDAGAHWNVITQPWEGHAVKVELVPTSYPASTRNSTVAAAPAGIVGGTDQQSQKGLTLAVGALAQTVEVQGKAQPALAATKVKEKISATRAAAPPVPRFEITTDAGEHWISTNGRSWQRKDE